MAKILQWNCRSIRQKKHDLLYLLNKYNPVIFALSETWLKPGSLLRVPGFSCFRDDRDDGWAGCALLVSRSIIYSQIPILQHDPGLHIVAIRAMDVSFVSAYIPHPDNNLISELNSILSSIPGPLVVLGDFNCRHTLWGSHCNDPSSSFLLDLLDDLNLCVLNDGSATRRTPPTQNVSVPDLSFASPSLVSIISWSVLPNSYGSDHFPILISLHNFHLPMPTIQPLQKYRLLQADWDKFSSLLDLELQNLPQINSSNFLDLYDNFVTSLLHAADSSIPLKNSARKLIPSPPWWDAECTDGIRKRKEAENTYTSTFNMPNYLNLKKISARTSRLLAKKKRAGWHNFCESLSPRSSVSLIWKKIKAYRRVFDDSSETLSNDPSTWLEEFINKLAPPSVPSYECFPTLDLPTPSSSNKFDDPFSLPELTCALSHLRDSSPGVDGIPYSFICKSSSYCKQLFLILINYFFVTGRVPESWKTQIIIPILKPGKDPKDPGSYRPIALSSVLAKIMENLIKNRLEWILESKGILPKTQFGFRRGMGTLDSLSIFISEVRIAFSKNESVLGVFLDIASAYDNVQLPLLRQKLLQLSIPVRLVNIIGNLLMSRSITIRHHNILSSSRLVWKGLPQGSVLSPILYNLYTYDLASSVSCFCKILQYADDIALYFNSSSLIEASSRINSALHYLNQWLSDHGLSLSVPKCNAVVFSRKRIIPPINLFVEDEPIVILDKVKFLGLILDSKLSGVYHLDYITKKSEKGVNVLRALSGVRWGAHPVTQKILYNSIVRSHFGLW